MKAFESNNSPKNSIVKTYELMTRKGNVGFFDVHEFLKIISYYQDAAQAEKALQVVSEAIGQHPFSSELYIFKTQLYLDLEALDMALESVEQAQALAPQSSEVLLLKAEVLVFAKRIGESTSILDSLSYENDVFIQSEIAFIRSLIAEQLKDFSTQFDYLETCLLKNPDNKAAYEKLWLSIQLQDYYEQGEILFKRLIDENAFNKDAWFHLGQVFRSTQAFQKAIEAFEYSFLIDEKFIKGYRECSLAAIEAAEYQKSLSVYEEMLKHTNPLHTDFLNIGRCYLELGATEIAKSFFLKVLVKNPNNDAAYHLLAICESKLPNFNKAVLHIKRAIQINPDNEEYYALLAEFYFHQGKTFLARKSFEKAVETAPDAVFIWVQYISFLLDIKQLGLALEVLYEAELNTFGTELIYTKFCVLFKKGSFDEAYEILEIALKLDYGLHPIVFEILPEMKNNLVFKSCLSNVRKS